ncbi:hypothetical protein CCHR01_13766 [Colletotrichum chrysophilum]|uniref:Uncharacterized protein n=1 Tax=Colletotrichum chrysophilum TaxID=1836956 RepID=A0AAD9ADN5_9PEZI|nr:hypothetical protein CCHR01_13766 [Colletotrichum chrysophilum]
MTVADIMTALSRLFLPSRRGTLGAWGSSRSGKREEEAGEKRRVTGDRIEGSSCLTRASVQVNQLREYFWERR